MKLWIDRPVIIANTRLKKIMPALGTKNVPLAFHLRVSPNSMKMTDKHILEIIKATPLVSIDLIIRNPSEKVLLGKRVNRPAKDYWFVPGGRIIKNETINHALKRISQTEVGLDLSTEACSLLGAYDHIYEDNFLNLKGINTHYVVLAFAIKLQKEIQVKPDDQHSEMKWWKIDKLLEDPTVHQNTKVYFKFIFDITESECTKRKQCK